MNILTQSEIGKRVKKARTLSNISQEALATAMGLRRSAITQIENGQRKLSSQELMQCSDTLGFSLDDFRSLNFLNTINSFTKSNEHIPQERISVPVLNLEKFKTVLLYILEKCAGKPNIGETALNKLLYFCDFNYYELYEEQLTGAEYKKLPYGPVPETIKEILNTLKIEEKLLSFIV